MSFRGRKERELIRGKTGKNNEKFNSRTKMPTQACKAKRKHIGGCPEKSKDTLMQISAPGPGQGFKKKEERTQS